VGQTDRSMVAGCGRLVVAALLPLWHCHSHGYQWVLGTQPRCISVIIAIIGFFIIINLDIGVAVGELLQQGPASIGIALLTLSLIWLSLS